jgi:8-oxo-dGTP diphosphatase
MFVPPRHIVAAGALVTNPTGKVLLVKHPRRGWEFPGGQVEEGEDITLGVKREVLEESGITARIEGLTGVYSNVTKQLLIFGFTAVYVSGVPTPSQESLEVAWVPRGDALTWVTHPSIKDRLRDKLAFDGRVIYRVYSMNPYTVISERYV